MQSSFGSYSKHEREALGVALQEVAVETRVPEASLKLIEEDRLDDLPGEVFVRGFLRAYARCIGLDPEEVVGRLDRPAPSPTMPLVHSTQLDLRRSRMASPALVLVLILASLLIALVLFRPVASPSFSAHVPASTTGTPG